MGRASPASPAWPLTSHQGARSPRGLCWEDRVHGKESGGDPWAHAGPAYGCVTCVQSQQHARSMAGIVASRICLAGRAACPQFHSPCFLAMIPALPLPFHFSVYPGGGRKQESK